MSVHQDYSNHVSAAVVSHVCTRFNWDGTSEHMNDKLSSLQGHTLGVITIYEHSHQMGDRVNLGPGKWPANLGTLGFNDKTSSHLW